MPTGTRWFTSRSAVRSSTFKKPPSGPWDGYFYTGSTVHFGHNEPKGAKK